MVAMALAMRCTGELMARGVDLFGAATHQALRTAQVPVDIGVEQLDEELIAAPGG